MTLQPQREPLWKQFKQRFGEEYICLKCKKITVEKRETCPNCNGVMCVRITSKAF